MTRFRRLLAPSILFSALSLSCASPQDATRQETEVLPGVLYRHVTDPQGPWEIHILEIDLTRPGYSLRGMRARDAFRGRETTSSMVARFPGAEGEVIAAINADFFLLESGESTNHQVVEGEFVKGIGPARALPRSQFGVRWDGRPFISRSAYEGEVRDGAGRVTHVGGVNIPPDSGWVSVFNRWYGGVIPESLRTRALDHLHLMPVGNRGDTVLYLRSGAAARDAAPALVWRHKDRFAGLADIQPNDTLRVLEGLEPAQGRVRTLLGGAPRIVLDGRSVAGVAGFMEGSSPEFSSKRHPRTGVGFSADSTRLWWFVVDGRQARSAGMTLPEFADLMIGEGVAQGLNLDGGGSTVMVVKGRVVNAPSDASGERPVANCLLLVADPRQQKPR
jgi:hypothetical protein